MRLFRTTEKKGPGGTKLNSSEQHYFSYIMLLLLGEEYHTFEDVMEMYRSEKGVWWQRHQNCFFYFIG